LSRKAFGISALQGLADGSDPFVGATLPFDSVLLNTVASPSIDSSILHVIPH